MAEAFSDQRRIESETIRKAGIRLVPFLVVCYFIAYVDRVNVGFAALTMNKDLGLTATAFGTGAALFFVAYVIFEVPSNLALERFGARRWIARIMISWGLVGLGSAFVTGAVTFSIARFLLGAAEAGFFPGVILYLTYWFPKAYRARIVAMFMVAIPVSSFLGSPLSAALLTLDGVGGLRGWQWLLICESIPALLPRWSCCRVGPQRRSSSRASRKHGWRVALRLNAAQLPLVILATARCGPCSRTSRSGYWP
jgi:MFS transporter, ACS family, tartrate transporter